MIRPFQNVVQLLLLTLIILPAFANKTVGLTISKNFSWTGTSNVGLTGEFSFEDALLGNIIHEDDLNSLSITVFENSINLGSWDLISDGLISSVDLEFNFDSSLNTFITWDGVFGRTLKETEDLNMIQRWNAAGAGCQLVGFYSGGGSQGVCVEGRGNKGNVHLTAYKSSLVIGPSSPLSPIPIPPSLLMFGTGLALIGFFGRRRKRKNPPA